MSIAAGQTLSHYRLIEKIGEGGMGVVWKAEDERLRRTVALKTLRSRLFTDTAAQQRFVREARAAAAINHPGIATVYEIDEVEGITFIVMEYVTGKSIRLLLREGRLDLQEALQIATKTAKGLAKAHQAGVIHRDLKPDNVMVNPDQEVRILDFGLAKLMEPDRGSQSHDPEGIATATEAMTREGQILGTVNYMSPEQTLGRPVDIRSDLFSFGIVLYELVTGRVPFVGESHVQTLSAIVHDPALPASSLNPDVSTGLDSILAKCLEKDPARRYQNTGDLVLDLERVAEEPATGSSRSYGPRAETSAGVERRRWIVLAAAVVVIAGAVLAYLRFGSGSGTAPDSLKIAVLPFENVGLSSDGYFAAGMTDEITSRLANVSGLRVISHNSAAAYDRSGKSTKQIGQDFEVDYVLEGTVRWDPGPTGSNRVRITPRLVRASDDTQLWSAPFDRVIDDVFAVQSEIAEQAARQLGVTLLDTERQAMRRQPTENLEAYHAYLRGTAHTGGQGILREDILAGIEMFEQAVQLDSNFALAYSDLSRAHSIYYHYGYDHSPERAAKAKAAVDRAFELDPSLPEAHFALGVYYYRVERDYERALEELRITERNMPSNAEAISVIAGIWRRQGLIEESIAKNLEALELSPQDPEHVIDIADSYYVLRRWEEALGYYDLSIAIRRDQTAAYTRCAWLSWLWKGDTETARAALEAIPDDRQSSSLALTTWFWQEIFEERYQAALDRLLTAPVSGMSPDTRYLLIAQGHQLMDQPALARDAYESAREFLEPVTATDPENYWHQASLGLAYAGLDRRTDAIRAGTRATELYPISKDPFDGPELVKNLALIHTMLGEHEMAMALLADLLALPNVGSSDYESLHPPSISVQMLRLDPRWAALREHPMFAQLEQNYE